MNFETLLPVLIALIGASGFWGLMIQRDKRKAELADKADERSAEFNDTLKEQVASLHLKVDKLIAEKEELLNTLSDVKVALAKAEQTIQHLESVIKLRSMYRED